MNDTETHVMSFQSLIDLYERIEKESGQIAKSQFIIDYVAAFQGNLKLLFKLLLPGRDQRVYNVKDKSMIKISAGLFGEDPEDLSRGLAATGDLAGTVSKFFAQSGMGRSSPTLTMEDVNDFLEKLNGQTTEDSHSALFNSFMKRCTPKELKWVIRLVNHDLKIGAGNKIVMAGLHDKAYDAFNMSNSIDLVVSKYLNGDFDQDWMGKQTGKHGASGCDMALFTAVKPMLARPSKSYEDAMKRCPKGMACEIKYDGERIQIHKQGNRFEYFSRNLKPITPSKVTDVMPSIVAATTADSIVLDGEILLIDKATQKPLPFGSLGVHKQKNFTNACICVFIFDILYLDGESVMGLPFSQRRKLMTDNVQEVPNRVKYSEMYDIKAGEKSKVEDLMRRCMSEGLEGLVMKGIETKYEPNARHWLKMKKDYLQGMADSVDLVVLGAYYGTGAKGGLLSVFLMGVWDERGKVWRTVCKCGNGHDDATIDRLQHELDVVKINKKAEKVPGWLAVHSSLVPDVVVSDPFQAPVWEIEGAEFSESQSHTADGISVRFPRITRIRTDKDARSATDMVRLRDIVEASKAHKPGSPSSPSKPASSQAVSSAPSVPGNQTTMAAFLKKPVEKKAQKKSTKRKRDSSSEEEANMDDDADDEDGDWEDLCEEDKKDDQVASDEEEVMPKKKQRGSVPFNSILEGVTIVISGIQNPERAAIRDKALSMGAKYNGDWGASSTHLISKFGNTPKYVQADRDGGKIVKVDWIHDCATQGRFLPERSYSLI